jgi:hypothetical protein
VNDKLCRLLFFLGAIEQVTYFFVSRFGEVFVPETDGKEYLRRSQAGEDDDQYFLSEVWWPSVITGYELVKTDKERALIKELSVGQSKPTKKKAKMTIKLVNQ